VQKKAKCSVGGSKEGREIVGTGEEHKSACLNKKRRGIKKDISRERFFLKIKGEQEPLRTKTRVRGNGGAVRFHKSNEGKHALGLPRGNIVNRRGPETKDK